jgi:hypothetical protein
MTPSLGGESHSTPRSEVTGCRPNGTALEACSGPGVMSSILTIGDALAEGTYRYR